jgi:hypothetical protein
MTIASASALLRLAVSRRGSQATDEPWYPRVSVSWCLASPWCVQSSAVTISATAFTRTVWEASVTSIPGRSVPIVQYLPVLEEIAINKATSAAIALLDTWLSDDSGYDEETWPELKAGLERDRLSARKLFDG